MREIIIADKQDITNLGIQYLINRIDREKIHVEVCNTKRELIECLSRYPFAVVIIDYSTIDFADVNEVIILRNRFRDSDWVLFSEDFSSHCLKQVVYNELAFSIVLKDSSEEEIFTALKLSLQKQRFICNQITNHLLQPQRISDKDEQRLTNTEKEILKDISLGRTTKEIASERNISTHTVVSHRKNIFRKLEVNNIHEATKYALRAGIIDIGDYYI